MLKVFVLILLSILWFPGILFANGEVHYKRAQEEFTKSTMYSAPIHITYAFHYLEKSASLGYTKAMFSLGLFSYQRQGLINKNIAMKWWDLYLEKEPNPNESFVKIINEAKKELEIVQQSLKELIESDAIDTDKVE